jgi:cytochrome b561
MPAEAAWSPVQRRLHWWTAALVALAFPLGFLMVWVPLRDLLAKFLLYQVHKSIGLIVLLLVAARLLLRLTRGRPAWDALPAIQRRLAVAMHALLYILLVVTPVLGYLVAATAPAQVPTLFLLLINVPHLLPTDPARYALLLPIHRAAAILLVVLACGHAAAAIDHHRRGRATLARMWPRLAQRAAAQARLSSGT